MSHLVVVKIVSIAMALFFMVLLTGCASIGLHLDHQANRDNEVPIPVPLDSLQVYSVRTPVLVTLVDSTSFRGYIDEIDRGYSLSLRTNWGVPNDEQINIPWRYIERVDKLTQPSGKQNMLYPIGIVFDLAIGSVLTMVGTFITVVLISSVILAV